jgi:hypothetical protein
MLQNKIKSHTSGKIHLILINRLISLVHLIIGLTFVVHKSQMDKQVKTGVLFSFLFFYCFIVTSANHSKPTIFNDTIRPYVYKGFNSLYNFEFKSTDSTIRFLKKNFSTSSWTYILEANYYWWKIISGEKNESYTNLFYTSLDKAKNHVKYLNTDEKYFLLILIYSFKSRVDLMEGKYLHTIIELKKHINIIKKTFGKENQYYAYYLSSGLYYYLTAVAYKNYGFLRSFMYFLPKGDKVKGIKYLNKKSGDFILETESRYFLMKIFDEVEDRSDLSIKYAEILCKKYPKNFIFQEHYLKSLAKTRNTPITTSEFNALRENVLNNKQLSKAQLIYFKSLSKKLLEVNS